MHDHAWDVQRGHFTLYKLALRTSSSFKIHSLEEWDFLIQDMKNKHIYNVRARCAPFKIVQGGHTSY